MDNLRKFWVKFLIAFVGAAIIDESIHYSTGNSEINPVRSWIFILVIYFVLAAIVWLYDWRKTKQEE